MFLLRQLTRHRHRVLQKLANGRFFIQYAFVNFDPAEHNMIVSGTQSREYFLETFSIADPRPAAFDSKFDQDV